MYKCHQLQLYSLNTNLQPLYTILHRHVEERSQVYNNICNNYVAVLTVTSVCIGRLSSDWTFASSVCFFQLWEKVPTIFLHIPVERDTRTSLTKLSQHCANRGQSMKVWFTQVVLQH